MAVHRLLRAIRQKFIKIASGAARLIIKPSTRLICAQPVPATKAVHQSPPPSPPHENNISAAPAAALSINHDDLVTGASSSTAPEQYSGGCRETASYDRHWKAVEEKILQDIEPLARLAKSILHYRGYRNGDRLTKKDEKDVIENLLKYHYGFKNKIGSGFKYIMVNRHVEFEDTRCMYVVRTDGSRIDFSYKKCLRGYVEHKYPSHAEKFVQWNPHLVK